jgi:hypothetical protein
MWRIFGPTVDELTQCSSNHQVAVMIRRWYLKAEAGVLFLSKRRNITTMFSREVKLKSFVSRVRIKGISKQAIQVLEVNASHRNWRLGVLGQYG